MKIRFAVAAALLPLAVVLASSTPATADDASAKMSFEDRQFWDEDDEAAREERRTASEKCAAKISVTLDVASFQGVDYERESPIASCRDAINTINAICVKQPFGKESVARSIASVTCRKSPDGPTKPSIKSGKAMVVDIDAKHPVDGSWATSCATPSPPSRSWPARPT